MMRADRIRRRRTRSGGAHSTIAGSCEQQEGGLGEKSRSEDAKKAVGRGRDGESRLVW